MAWWDSFARGRSGGGWTRPTAGLVVLVYPGELLAVAHRKGPDAWVGMCLFGHEGLADYRALTFRVDAR